MTKPDTVRELVKDFYKAKDPVGFDQLLSAFADARSDLFWGPSPNEEGKGFTTLVEEIRSWWDENGCDMYLDTCAGYVTDSEPDFDEVDEEGNRMNWSEDWLRYDSSEVKRILFKEVAPYV